MNDKLKLMLALGIYPRKIRHRDNLIIYELETFLDHTKYYWSAEKAPSWLGSLKSFIKRIEKGEIIIEEY